MKGLFTCHPSDLSTTLVFTEVNANTGQLGCTLFEGLDFRFKFTKVRNQEMISPSNYQT